MQEVWCGRLPRLGVVNSIERKKFEGRRYKAQLKGQLSITHRLMVIV